MASGASKSAKPPRKVQGKTKFAQYREGMTPPELRLTMQLVLVARRWRTLLDERLRPIEQSTARMEALAAIYASPPRSPQIEIAKRLRIEGPTLTRMLDGLEKDGLVERLADPTDRRTKLLRLTPTGEDVLATIFEVADAPRMKLVEGLPDGTIAELNTMLAELIRRLDTGLPG